MKVKANVLNNLNKLAPEYRAKAKRFLDLVSRKRKIIYAYSENHNPYFDLLVVQDKNKQYCAMPYPVALELFDIPHDAGQGYYDLQKVLGVEFDLIPRSEYDERVKFNIKRTLTQRFLELIEDVKGEGIPYGVDSETGEVFSIVRFNSRKKVFEAYYLEEDYTDAIYPIDFVRFLLRYMEKTELTY